MQGTDLINVSRQSLLDLGVMTKVDRFDFKPITAFVHDLGLTCDASIPVASYCYRYDLMQSGSRILEEFQHSLLPWRDFSAIEQSIDYRMDTLAHIRQFLA